MRDSSIINIMDTLADYCTVAEYDSTDELPESLNEKFRAKAKKYSEYAYEKYLDTSSGESPSRGKSPERGNPKERGRGKSKVAASGSSIKSDVIFTSDDDGPGPSKSTSVRESPEGTPTKYPHKLHGKSPHDVLAKFREESAASSTKEELEQYHFTHIEGSSAEDYIGDNILSKITGLELESHVNAAKQTKQQHKSFRASGITPKFPRAGAVGLEEGKGSVNERLYNACFRGDLRTVQEILQVHYDTLMPDEHGQTPLYAACIGNQPEIIEYLVERGYVVDHKDNEGKTPLHIAFECEQPDIANLLLRKYKANFKVRDDRNWTPLHSAIDHGYYDVSSTLSRLFLELDVSTDVSWLQLFAACYERRLDAVEFLVATNVDVNHVSSAGNTALNMACDRCDYAIVKLLLDNGAEETMNMRTQALYFAPLHRATARNHKHIVQLLLDHGADPNIICVKQKTPVHMAAMKEGHTEVLQVLLNFPRTNLNAVDSGGKSSLHCAVEHRNLAAISLLLSRGADANIVNHKGRTPLYLAIHIGEEKIVEKLLDEGADPNLLDSHGNNCLHLALFKRREAVIPSLLKAGADVSASDKDGDSCLQLAIYTQSSASILQMLIEYGAPLEHMNNRGYTALISATRKRRVDAIQLLLNSGCNPNTTDREGDTVLHNAVHKSCSREIVQAILDHGANLDAVNLKGHTALVIACADDPVDVFQLLLEKGADPNVGDWDGTTPLHIACSKKDSVKTALLLMHGADPMRSSADPRIPIPLNCAARARDPALLEVFFHHDPTLLDKAIDGDETALHLSCRKGWADRVEWLISHGVDKDKVCANETALELAWKHGHKTIVMRLLDAGADASLNALRRGFVGTIYQQRNMELLHYIVSRSKVDLTARDGAGETLLWKACRDDDLAVVQMLLNCKRDIGLNLCNNQGQSPVWITCANTSKSGSKALSILSLVLHNKQSLPVDVDKADNKQTTPLHLVCEEDSPMMVNLIAATSSGSINARDALGRTPLQLAKSTQVTDILLRFGARKD